MTTYESAKVDGPAVYRRWTLIAADVDGIPCGNRGEVTQEVERRFSQKADADQYANDLRGMGMDVSGPTPLACQYFGPTDSPSNAWSVRGESPAVPDPSTLAGALHFTGQDLR